MVGNLMFSADT